MKVKREVKLSTGETLIRGNMEAYAGQPDGWFYVVTPEVMVGVPAYKALATIKHDRKVRKAYEKALAAIGKVKA